MILADVIVRSAEAGLLRQDSASGAMPAGHNGWVGDAETPVRNTGHWCIIFFKAYELSGEARFETAGISAANWLLTRDARPMGATFWHRLSREKDACNGVIGTGFSVAALMAAYAATNDGRYRETAQEVFRLHPFDSKRGIWKRVNVDGSVPRGLLYDFDLTLNHQIWMAAAGALADPNNETEIAESTRQFLDGLDRGSTLSVTYQGRIIDEVYPSTGLLDVGISTLRRVHRMLSLNRRKTMRLKEWNYQGYSLFNLARIAEVYPDHSLWQSRQLGRAVRMVSTDKYRRRLAANVNKCWTRATGFELAKALEVFGSRLASSREVTEFDWVNLELTQHFDFEAGTLTLNANDIENQAANLYVATYLSEQLLKQKLKDVVIEEATPPAP